MSDIKMTKMEAFRIKQKYTNRCETRLKRLWVKEREEAGERDGRQGGQPK